MLRKDHTESHAGPLSDGDSESTDVVIVGYGPVGAMVANLLGQAGIRTIVFERDVKPHSMPRAGAPTTRCSASSRRPAWPISCSRFSTWARARSSAPHAASRW